MNWLLIVADITTLTEIDSMIDYAFDEDDSTYTTVDNDQFFKTVIFGDDLYDANISDITLNIEVELLASDMTDNVYIVIGKYQWLNLIGYLIIKDYGWWDVVSVNYRIETKKDEADDRSMQSSGYNSCLPGDSTCLIKYMIFKKIM